MKIKFMGNPFLCLWKIANLEGNKEELLFIMIKQYNINNDIELTYFYKEEVSEYLS